jgi:elongation factor P
MKIEAGSLKKGMYVVHNGEIWQVLKTDFSHYGRGSASVRVRMKNVLTGAVLENASKSVFSYEQADVEPVLVQYLYKDGTNVIFMDQRTYEQHELSQKAVGDIVNFLKEGDSVYIVMHDGKPISMRPPQSVKLKVIEADDAVKGDTATAPKKTVTVETGVTVKVPLFIKKDEIIVINPETGEYVERATN